MWNYVLYLEPINLLGFPNLTCPIFLIFLFLGMTINLHLGPSIFNLGPTNSILIWFFFFEEIVVNQYRTLPFFYKTNKKMRYVVGSVVTASKTCDFISEVLSLNLPRPTILVLAQRIAEQPYMHKRIVCSNFFQYTSSQLTIIRIERPLYNTHQEDIKRVQLPEFFLIT